MAMFGGFFLNVPRKNRNFFCRHLLAHICKINLIQVMPFLNSIFFKNIQGVTLWLSNRCFRGQKWRRNIGFQKILSADYWFNFQIYSMHAFDRADQTTGRGFSKNWIFRVLCDFLYDYILPVTAHTTINISRNNFLLAKSCGYHYFNFFKTFILIVMFNWIGACEYGPMWIIHQYWLLWYIWIRNGQKIWQNSWIGPSWTRIKSISKISKS